MDFPATKHATSKLAAWSIIGAGALLALTCLAASHAGTMRRSHADMVLSAIDNHIVPRLDKLVTATQALQSDVKALCEKPGDAKLLKSAQKSFADTVGAWGAIDFIRFGPVAEQHRLERFFFWPDPRGTTERQLQALLANRDPKLLEEKALEAESVAVQGLGALEFILWNDKKPLDAGDEGAQYRCSFATAIATNLADIAHDLVQGWTAPDGWRAKMLATGSDNPLYKDASESAREMVKALVMGIGIIQDRNIIARLNALKAATGKRVRFAFERSGLSERYLQSEITSLEAFYDAVGLTDYIPPDKKWMHEFVPRSFNSLHDNIGLLIKTKDEDKLDEKTEMNLRRLRFDANGVRQVITRELAPAADLVLGFNELDGD